jgi:hypothetical protein
VIVLTFFFCFWLNDVPVVSWRPSVQQVGGENAQSDMACANADEERT